jgi:hypothetical protein
MRNKIDHHPKLKNKKILIYFHAKLTSVKDSAFFGQRNKMRHIDFFRANKRTGPGGMTAVNPLIAVQYFQPLVFLLFTRVHYAHNACQHGIGPQKTVMTADTGRRTAKTINTSGGIDIMFQSLRH